MPHFRDKLGKVGSHVQRGVIVKPRCHLNVAFDESAPPYNRTAAAPRFSRREAKFPSAAGRCIQQVVTDRGLDQSGIGTGTTGARAEETRAHTYRR